MSVSHVSQLFEELSMNEIPPNEYVADSMAFTHLLTTVDD